jgi:hypothetical protein
MINPLLTELKETWGYETEELSDIRSKMEELANSCFWEGYNEAMEEYKPKSFTAYGKQEDYE